MQQLGERVELNGLRVLIVSSGCLSHRVSIAPVSNGFVSLSNPLACGNTGPSDSLTSRYSTLSEANALPLQLACSHERNVTRPGQHNW
jgi:hypothetical protein